MVLNEGWSSGRVREAMDGGQVTVHGNKSSRACVSVGHVPGVVCSLERNIRSPVLNDNSV